MNLHAFPQKFQKKLHFLIQVFKKSNLGQIILIQAFIFSLGILGQNKQVSNNSKFYIRYTFLISFGNLNGIRKGKKPKIRTLIIYRVPNLTCPPLVTFLFLKIEDGLNGENFSIFYSHLKCQSTFFIAPPVQPEMAPTLDF